VSAFIDQYHGRFAVEPICRTLDVSASAYYERKTGQRSARRVEDERLTAVIRRVHRENYECYGQRRMHAALLRQGERVGRDHVARLMRQNGVRGAKRRGKPWRECHKVCVRQERMEPHAFNTRKEDSVSVGSS
jgi:putative transposase